MGAPTNNPPQTHSSSWSGGVIWRKKTVYVWGGGLLASFSPACSPPPRFFPQYLRRGNAFLLESSRQGKQITSRPVLGSLQPGVQIQPSRSLSVSLENLSLGGKHPHTVRMPSLPCTKRWGKECVHMCVQQSLMCGWPAPPTTGGSLRRWFVA